MRILGIDPGLLRTGWGIVESRGGRVSHVASGVIRIPTDFDLPARLRMVFEGVQRVVEEHVPDLAAIEDVFVNMNPRTTLLLGQARGVAIAALATSGLPVAEYGAMQIKQAVTGHGRATKDQVQRLVAMLLSLPEAPRKDEADALACALCHAHGGATSGTLAAAHAAAGTRAATLAQGAVSRAGGRLSAGGPAELPPALAALGLRVRRGRLVRQ